MIDDKKTDEAARKRLVAFRKANPDGYSSSIIDIESDCLNNFKDGAKWVINEFIKDLWHAIDENPKKYHKCLVEVVYHRPLNMTDEIDYVTSHLTNFGWDESSFKRSDYTIKRWIYIDDLLKGCNHD